MVVELGRIRPDRALAGWLLGNVLTTVLDRKTAVVDTNSTGDTVMYYIADVYTAQCYYAFGSSMPGLAYLHQDTAMGLPESEGGGYRFGFNNQEKESGLGDYYSFEYRVHDARIGRFLSVDKWSEQYSSQSPYVFAFNQPVLRIDWKGLGDEKDKPRVGAINIDDETGVVTIYAGRKRGWVEYSPQKASAMQSAVQDKRKDLQDRNPRHGKRRIDRQIVKHWADVEQVADDLMITRQDERNRIVRDLIKSLTPAMSEYKTPNLLSELSMKNNAIFINAWSNSVETGQSIIPYYLPGSYHGSMSSINGIVLHRTAGPSLASSINSWKVNNLATHFVVTKDGSIYQIIESLTTKTWHVGNKSGNIGNWNSVGIEVVGQPLDIAGNATSDPQKYKICQYGWEALTPQQVTSVSNLVNYLYFRLDLDFSDVYCHEDLVGKCGEEGRTVLRAVEQKIK